MKLFDKISRHAGLMGDMAETLGVDFAARIAHDPALVAQYREAVMRCAHCSHEGECEGWLAGHDHADATPDYCRNKDLLEALSKG